MGGKELVKYTGSALGLWPTQGPCRKWTDSLQLLPPRPGLGETKGTEGGGGAVGGCRGLLSVLCCSGDMPSPGHYSCAWWCCLELNSEGRAHLGSEPWMRKYDSRQYLLSALQFTKKALLLRLDNLILITSQCRRPSRHDPPHSTDDNIAALRNLPSPCGRVWIQI